MLVPDCHIFIPDCHNFMPITNLQTPACVTPRSASCTGEGVLVLCIDGSVLVVHSVKLEHMYHHPTACAKYKHAHCQHTASSTASRPTASRSSWRTAASRCRLVYSCVRVLCCCVNFIRGEEE